MGATKIETNVDGLSFTIGSDGVWMHLEASKQHAAINLVSYGKESGIIGGAVLAWCREITDKGREIERLKRIINTSKTLNKGKRMKDMRGRTCRKCSKHNPWVYLAPVADTCICMDCAKERGWLDRDGNLKPGIEL